MKKHLGELGLIVTAMIWGSGFVASAISLEHFTPNQILAGRFLIAAIIMGAVYHRKIMTIRKTTLIRGVIIGVFLYLGFALQTVGLQFTTPSKNAFLTAVNVVIVPFIAFVLYKRRIDRYEIAGAIMAVIGVGLISLKFSLEINVGDLLTLGCAIAFAFQIFYTSIYIKYEEAAHLTFIQLATAAVIGLMVVLSRGEGPVQSVDMDGIIAIVYLGIFSTSLAYFLQTVAQQTVTETKTAIFLSTESVWGMFFSMLLLHEAITVKMVAGAILIIIAILTSETKLPLFRKKRTVGDGTEMADFQRRKNQ